MHFSNHVFRSKQFQNYEAHVFFQNVQTLMQIPKMQLKKRKMPLVSKIIKFKLVAVNSPCYDENTRHPQ